jgi:hypothetical protein
VAVIALAIPAAPVGAAEPAASAEDFATKLAALAERCDALGLVEQARTTRNWIIPRDPRRQYFFVVPESDSARPTTDAPTVVQQWYAKFRELRRAHAESLWAEVHRDLEEGRAPTAFQKVHELLRHDPDHAEARRVLGYQRVGDRWQTPDRIRTQPGRTTHQTFGWRRNEYWYVDSPHFRITTNANPQAATLLAMRFENAYTVWRQLFFEVWCSADLLRQVLNGTRQFARRSSRYEVVVFRDRDEYLAQLRKIEPQIDVTLAYYHKGQRTAFFYAGDDSPIANQYHEVTHQLFHECEGAAADPGETGDFWICEGMALYLESLRFWDGFCTLGGVESDRLQLARARRLSGEFYLPLAELVELGRIPLQQHPELRRIYTQAAGLTHFLMDGQQGQLRVAAIDYASQVNAGRQKPHALATLCGRPLAELDAQYAEFLQVDDEELRQWAELEVRQRAIVGSPPGERATVRDATPDASRPALSAVENLRLGRTRVTDAGLRQLQRVNLDRLQCLDLSFTATTDAGLACLRSARQLKQLFLESTKIGDQALEVVSEYSQLEELDLSHTAVSEQGLTRLDNLTELKVLWLAGIEVSDDTLSRLKTRLPNVEVR